MGRPRSFDPEEALERATELFWSEGYRGVSVADLIEELGICRSSLYAAFGGKRALFERALDRYGELLEREVLAPLADRRMPARRRIERVFRRAADRHARGGWRGCLLARSALTLGGEDERVAERARRFTRRLDAAFRRALEDLRAEGTLAPQVDAAALARVLTHVFQGVGLSGALRRDARALRAIARDALVVLDAAPSQRARRLASNSGRRTRRRRARAASPRTERNR